MSSVFLAHIEAEWGARKTENICHCPEWKLESEIGAVHGVQIGRKSSQMEKFNSCCIPTWLHDYILLLTAEYWLSLCSHPLSDPHLSLQTLRVCNVIKCIPFLFIHLIASPISRDVDGHLLQNYGYIHPFACVGSDDAIQSILSRCVPLPSSDAIGSEWIWLLLIRIFSSLFQTNDSISSSFVASGKQMFYEWMKWVMTRIYWSGWISRKTAREREKEGSLPNLFPVISSGRWHWHG